MRTALRTAITTAALAGAVLTPVAGAHAATQPAVPTTATATPSPTATATPSATATVPGATTPSATATPTGAPTPRTTGAPTTTAPAKSPAATATPSPASDVPTTGGLGRHPLADGGFANLFRTGPHSYVAFLVGPDNKPTGRLEANGSGAGDQFGTVFVTLEADGTLSSWRNPQPGGGGYSDVRDGCTVTRYAAAPFQGVDMALSNSPTRGPVARLSQNGKVIAVLDRAHDTALYGGARIKGLLDPAPSLPMFQMRVHGGPIPWDGLVFPAVPKDCAEPVKGGSGSPAGHRTQTGGGATATPQTAVVPKGSVAAGAEPVTTETVATEAGGTADRSLLFAGGAALAGAGAAGVALALFRRRGTAV